MASLLITLLAVAPVRGALVAGQDFDLLPLASVAYKQVSNGEALGLVGTSYGGGESGLGFESYWHAAFTGKTQGPSTTLGDPDLNGVSAVGLDHLPVISADGDAVVAGEEQYFVFDDVDGRLDLHFDPVDISQYTAVTVSLKFWVNSDPREERQLTWNDDAQFGLNISDGVETEQVYFIQGSALGALSSKGSPAPTWHTISWSRDSSALTGTSLEITVSTQNNGKYNTIVIDDLRVEGISVPEPGAGTLIQLGFLLALAGRRRRRPASVGCHG